MTARRRLLASATLAAATLAFAPTQAQAETEVSFILNWIAGGDHAPYFYALQEGWYEQAGLDLEIQPGRGSAMAAQQTGIGRSNIGLADLGTVLVAAGKGADVVAVMNIYANSPQGLYWLKSSGIAGIEDFPGRSIGNPPQDAARAMWPALAAANQIAAESVTWVNVQPAAKLAALKSGSVDIVTQFYNTHHIFSRELGDDMGFLAWRDIGLNPYGNSIIVNRDFLESNEAAVASFVSVTQRAFHTCVQTPEPCVQALVDANTGLDYDNELANWGLVVELMTDDTSTNVGLGFFDRDRLDADYELVSTYLGLDEPFDIQAMVTNEHLDESLKMPAAD